MRRDPPGWTFGLGVACAAFERLRLERQAGDDFRARESQVAGLAESRRRAEAARASAEQRAEHIERELREERQSRRDRDAQAGQRVAAAERKAAEIEHEIAEARTAAEAADARLEREAIRARKVDEEMRELRRAVKEAEAKARAADAGLPVLRRDDLRALVDAADIAQRLATGLSGVADQARRVLERNSSDDTSASDAPVGDSEKEKEKKEKKSGSLGGAVPTPGCRPAWWTTTRMRSTPCCERPAPCSSWTVTTCRCWPGATPRRPSSATAC